MSQITDTPCYDVSVTRYLAAVSPPDIRGAIGAGSQVSLRLFFLTRDHLLLQLAIAMGVFLGLLLGLPYEFDENLKPGYEWWRFMFLLASVPPIFQVIDLLPAFHIHPIILYLDCHDSSHISALLSVTSRTEKESQREGV